MRIFIVGLATLIFTFTTPVLAPASICPGDLDDSGDVGFSDIFQVIMSWGPCPQGGVCAPDIDENGFVEYPDILQLLGLWGPCTVAACGNALVETLASEQCDDGNLLDGDGCSNSCVIEEEYSCFGEPSSCDYALIIYSEEDAIVGSAMGEKFATDTEWVDDEFIASGVHWLEESHVYIYGLQENAWTPLQTITSPSSTNDSFGSSLKREGNIMIVGAPFEGHMQGINPYGAAYIYRRNASGQWDAEADLTDVETQIEAGYKFGKKVDLEGNRAYVVAPGAVNGEDTFNGRIYEFEYDSSASPPWIKTNTILPPSGPTSSFSTYFAVQENTLIVSNYVFERSNGQWNLMQVLEHSGSRSIDIRGNLALMGNSGSVTIYRKDNGSWNYVTTIESENSDFGRTVKVWSENKILISEVPFGSNPNGYHYIYRNNGFEWVNDQVIDKVCSSFSVQQDTYVCGNFVGFGAAIFYSPTDNICGNGILGEFETCDDGNTENGDGCSANCQEIEFGFNCDEGSPTICIESIVSRIFVTSQTWKGGEIGGLAGADQKCQTAANNAGLSSQWTAWLSDSTTDAQDEGRVFHNLDGAYHRMDNERIVFGWDLLIGCEGGQCLENPILFNEYSVEETVNWGVWTGTSKFGEHTGSSCNNWTSSSPNDLGTWGEQESHYFFWTSRQTWPCDYELSLYCFENPGL